MCNEQQLQLNFDATPAKQPRKRKATATPEQLAQAARQLLVLAQAANKGKIRTGYYAIDGKRYKLDAPTTGKWAGWQFLKTGSDYHDTQRMLSVRPSGELGNCTEHARQVYAQIIADPVQAMLDYAAITGVCGVCGRKLEDATSVAIGIGPVCLNKLVG